MWELDHKESWVPKNWCFRTVVLEKTLESPLDSKEIQPVSPKGNQHWIPLEGLMPKFQYCHHLSDWSDLIWCKELTLGKDPDAGKDWRQEEKGTTENEMIGWHHRLNGHEFEQTLGDSEGQVSLSCYSPWGHKESDMTYQWNNKDANIRMYKHAMSKIAWLENTAFICRGRGAAVKSRGGRGPWLLEWFLFICCHWSPKYWDQITIEFSYAPTGSWEEWSTLSGVGWGWRRLDCGKVPSSSSVGTKPKSS